MRVYLSKSVCGPSPYTGLNICKVFVNINKVVFTYESNNESLAEV